MTADNTTNKTKPILTLSFKNQLEESASPVLPKDGQPLKQTLEHPSTLLSNSIIHTGNNQQSSADFSKNDRPKFLKRGKKLISNESYQSILKYMQEHYSKCFPKTKPLLPLAIGIHHQIFAAKTLPFSRLKIRCFLKRYTQIKNYRKRLIVGHDRFGLDGLPTSKILEEEIDKLKSRSTNNTRKNQETITLPANNQI